MGKTLVENVGISLADVVAMCVSGELQFEIGTRHHGKNIEAAALQRIRADPKLLEILRTATKKKCPVFFVQGPKCQARRAGIYIGVDCPTDEVSKLFDHE